MSAPPLKAFGMTIEAPITALHTYGFSKEEKLKSRLEEAIGEPLTKTALRFAQMDFLGDTHHVELKSRRAPVLPETYDTWLLPVSKVPRKVTGIDTIYFYHFEADDSLWFMYYDATLFNTFKREVPVWHPTGQEHFYIPKKEWSKV